MPGISATQGGTVVNAAGAASFSAPQPGIVTGSGVVLAVVGATHYRIDWSDLGVPGDSLARISDPTVQQPSFSPAPGGVYTVRAVGYSIAGTAEATYMLPLLVEPMAITYFAGVVSLKETAPSAVELPTGDEGGRLLSDDTNGNRPTWMARDGTLSPLTFTGDPALLPAMADDDVETPASGVFAFYSTDRNAASFRDANGDLFDFLVAPV